MAGNEQIEENIQNLPKNLELAVVNMDKILYEKRVNSVILPVLGGSLAILPGHTPLFTKLIKGILEIEDTDNTRENIEIEGGIAKVKQGKIVVLVGF